MQVEEIVFLSFLDLLSEKYLKNLLHERQQTQCQ